MKTQQFFVVLLAAISSSYAVNCMALETITVEGWTVTCQNRCIVTNNPDGSIEITDSKNGWIDATPPIGP